MAVGDHQTNLDELESAVKNKGIVSFSLYSKNRLDTKLLIHVFLALFSDNKMIG